MLYGERQADNSICSVFIKKKLKKRELVRNDALEKRNLLFPASAKTIKHYRKPVRGNRTGRRKLLFYFVSQVKV